MAKVIGEVKFYPYVVKKTNKIYVLKPAVRGDVEIPNLSKKTTKVMTAKIKPVSGKTKKKESNLPLLLAFAVLSATIYSSLKS